MSKTSADERRGLALTWGNKIVQLKRDSMKRNVSSEFFDNMKVINKCVQYFDAVQLNSQRLSPNSL